MTVISPDSLHSPNMGRASYSKTVMDGAQFSSQPTARHMPLSIWNLSIWDRNIIWTTSTQTPPKLPIPPQTLLAYYRQLSTDDHVAKPSWLRSQLLATTSPILRTLLVADSLLALSDVSINYPTAWLTATSVIPLATRSPDRSQNII